MFTPNFNMRGNYGLAIRRSAIQTFDVAPTGGTLLPYAVPKLWSLIRYWLPVLVWMWVIFSASGDQSSFQRSSRIIGPFVRWIFPHLSDNAVQAIVVIVRKCAHLTEYAVLALLLWRGLRKPAKPNAAPWRWSEAGLALALVALYAASDEIHQTLVPSRQGCVTDVLLDTTGAALGLLSLWAVFSCRRKRRR
jgi:VanZ family protein